MHEYADIHTCDLTHANQPVSLQKNVNKRELHLGKARHQCCQQIIKLTNAHSCK